MIRRPPRSTRVRSSAASDVYKRQRCPSRGCALATGVLRPHQGSVMASEQTFVIVGASLAGAKAAETLRIEGFDGRVVLIGEETERPYERPLLSKEYLRGEKPAAKLYVHDEGFYADNDIELLTGTQVASFDPAMHELTMKNGSRMPYSRLLLSTGAVPRRLPLPGADLPGVRYLRDMGDSDALRTAIGTTSRVVVIGAGWIGSEAVSYTHL